MESGGMFLIKQGSEWINDALKKPDIKSLWQELWYENEFCILYAETNVGKSILAVQIADEISRLQKVLYFDFELSEKVFQKRYTDDENRPYIFNDNFLRAVINSETWIKKGEDFIIDEIEKATKATNSKVLIIDNITYLGASTEVAKDATPLMQRIKQLKDKYNISILCLAHTPKRNPSFPITINDLKGSSMIGNFIDSAFAIGRSSKGSQIRYVKQIKSRMDEIKHGEDNVIVTEILKKGSFLKFEFVHDVHSVHSSHEREHLKIRTSEDWEKISQDVIELKKKGLSVREISEKLAISTGKVSKITKATVHG